MLGLSQRSQMPLTGKPPYPLPSGMPDFCSSGRAPASVFLALIECALTLFVDHRLACLRIEFENDVVPGLASRSRIPRAAPPPAPIKTNLVVTGRRSRP